MDVVEITIVVVEEDEDEEKDFFPMIKEIIGTHTKMKVVGMIKSKHKRFATYTVWRSIEYVFVLRYIFNWSVSRIKKKKRNEVK